MFLTCGTAAEACEDSCSCPAPSFSWCLASRDNVDIDKRLRMCTPCPPHPFIAGEIQPAELSHLTVPRKLDDVSSNQCAKWKIHLGLANEMVLPLEHAKESTFFSGSKML